MIDGTVARLQLLRPFRKGILLERISFKNSLEIVYILLENSLEKVQQEDGMFKRKIMSEFEAWKNTGGKKKALVVKGLRQIGNLLHEYFFIKFAHNEA